MKKFFLLCFLYCTAFINLYSQDTQAFRKFSDITPLRVGIKIFGAVPTTKKDEFMWKPNYSELFDFSDYISFDGYCHTKHDTTLSFTMEGSSYTVLIYSTIKYEDKNTISDCHSCAPLTSITVFRKEADKSFSLENFKKAFMSFGGFGQRGKIGIEKIGQDKIALRLQYGYMGQGDFSERVEYYSLTYPYLWSIFSYESENSSNNTGEQEIISLTATPNKNSAYYDFILSTKKNGKLLPLKQRYSFDAEKNMYVLMK